MSENAIVDVTNVSDLEYVHVVSENNTNSAPIVSNNQPNQNDFTKCRSIMSIYHIDPYIAEEQSTDNYATNDQLQNNVNIVMSTACNIESSFDTEAANNLVIETSPNVHNVEDPLVSAFTEVRLKNPYSLIAAHVNINSLKKEYKAHIYYFKDILQTNLIDILCISESKLDENIVENDLDCSPQFKLYRKDRSSTSGGLAIWLRYDIPQQRMYHFEFDSDEYHVQSMILVLIIKREVDFNIGIQKF